MILGKIAQESAGSFVVANPLASIGSMSADGTRRVNGPDSLRAAFEQAGGILEGITVTTAATECVPCQKTGLGDAIKQRLVQETGDTKVCDECQAEIDRLNTMSAEEVLEDAESLSQRIAERAKTEATSLIHRTAARVAPGVVARTVQNWIESAVSEVIPPSPEENGAVDITREPEILQNIIYPCQHLGDKLATCCGVPDTWMCGKHGGCCVASRYDKAKMVAQTQAEESAGLHVCEICKDYSP